MFDEIFVNRNNIIKTESYMNTKNIIKIIKSNISYNMNLTSDEKNNIKYIEFEGNWIKSNENINNTNILGGIGLLLTDKEIKIPINEGLKEYFMYYNCFLLEKDDKIIFDSKDMPLFEMEIGKNYFKNYILNKDYANGMYIEYHNTTHYYISNEKSDGFIILGKNINNKYKISAIKIPKNKALFIPPYVLHNDCCLVGQYNVMYNIADDFETVRLVNRNNKEEFTKIVFD